MAKNDDAVSNVVADAKRDYPNAVQVSPLGATGALRRVDMGGKQDIDKKLEKTARAASRSPMKFRLRKEK